MRKLALLIVVLFIAPITCAQSTQDRVIKLYFPNTKLGSGDCGAKVYPVTRRIPRTPAVARVVLDQLFGGPSDEEKAKGFYSYFS